MANLKADTVVLSFIFQPVFIHLKVPETLWEGGLRWERPIDDELEFFGSGDQSIPDVNSDGPRHFAYEAPDLGLEIRRVVNDVYVGMADPRLSYGFAKQVIRGAK